MVTSSTVASLTVCSAHIYIFLFSLLRMVSLSTLLKMLMDKGGTETMLAIDHSSAVVVTLPDVQLALHCFDVVTASVEKSTAL